MLHLIILGQYILCYFIGFRADIIVSQGKKSKDSAKCGTIELPCRTLQVAVTNAKVYDTILLKGGNKTSQYTYILRQPLRIDKELTFTRYGIKEQPIISMKTCDYKMMFNATKSFNISFVMLNFSCCTYTDLRNPPVFFSLNSNFVNTYVTVHKIKFTFPICLDEQIFTDTKYMFEIAKGNWTVKVLECSITSYNDWERHKTLIEKLDPSLKQIAKNKSISWDASVESKVYVENCYFRSGSSFRIASGKRIAIKFTRNLFHETYLYSDNYSTLEIVDSNFNTSSAWMYGINYIQFQNVTFFKNANLRNIFQIRFADIGYIMIKDSTFQNSNSGALAVDNATIVLINSNFLSNVFEHYSTGQSNVQLTLSTIMIYDCHFSNNSAFSIVPGTFNIQDRSLQGWIFPFYINNTDIFAGISDTYNINPVIKIADMDSIKENIFGNTSIICPLNYFLSMTPKCYDTDNAYLDYLVFCVQCDIKHYNLQRHARIVYNNSTKKGFDVHNITCMPCPYGATCGSGRVKSKGNYWGYLNEERLLVFIHCPTSYCCLSRDQCQSYDTCNKNRVGRLCGQCINKHSLSLFGNSNCVSNNRCIGTYFWVIYALICSLYLVVFLYLEEVILFLKRGIQFIICKTSEGHLHVRSDVEEFENSDDQNENTNQNSPFLFQTVGDETNAESYAEESTKTAGVIKILFFYYQIVSIIRIDTSTKLQYTIPVFADVLTSFFNIRIDIRSSPMDFCPIKDASVLQIEIVKTGFLLISILTLLIVSLFSVITRKAVQLYYKDKSSKETIQRTYKAIDENTPSYSKLPFRVRVMCTCLQLLLFGYASITMLIFKSVHCVEIDGDSFLYVEASVQCYTIWQIVLYMLFPIWVIPLPFALYFASKLLRNCCITPNQFLVVIFFPPILIWYIIKSRERTMNQQDAMCAKHLLKVINLPFRIATENNLVPVEWEPVLILRRAILVACAIFIPSPIGKLYPIGLLLLLILFHHIITQPYKENVLNYIELTSLLNLCFLNMLNIFWAFSDELDITNSSILYGIGKILIYTELCFLMMPFGVLVVYLIYMIFGNFILKRILCKQD